MKKIARILVLVTALSLLAAMCFSACAGADDGSDEIYGNYFPNPGDKANYEESEEYDRRTRESARIPSPDEDFEDDTVVIILDGKHSGTCVPGSVYSYHQVILELWRVGNLDTDNVTELFAVKPGESVGPTYRVMLEVKLKVPGKDKVVEAIKALQDVDMVLVAEPQYNYGVVYD